MAGSERYLYPPAVSALAELLSRVLLMLCDWLAMVRPGTIPSGIFVRQASAAGCVQGRDNALMLSVSSSRLKRLCLPRTRTLREVMLDTVRAVATLRSDLSFRSFNQRKRRIPGHRLGEHTPAFMSDISPPWLN